MPGGGRRGGMEAGASNPTMSSLAISLGRRGNKRCDFCVNFLLQARGEGGAPCPASGVPNGRSGGAERVVPIHSPNH